MPAPFEYTCPNTTHIIESDFIPLKTFKFDFSFLLKYFVLYFILKTFNLFLNVKIDEIITKKSKVKKIRIVR